MDGNESPLAEDHHAAGKNIRAFNGDGDWRALISPRQEVSAAEHNAFTTGNIHCIDDRALAAVGTVVLHDCRQYRRFFAKHNAVGYQRGGSIHYVGVACNTRQRFFDPFHFTDGDFELAANVRIGAGGHGDRLQAPGGVRWQVIPRPTDKHSTSIRQPWPAMVGPPIM